MPVVEDAFDQRDNPPVGQRGNEQKSIEQAIEQAPAIGRERRPGSPQQIIRIRCEKRRFEQDIAYDLALLRLVLQRFNRLPPPVGAVGRLLKKPLTEQPHGAMPPRERGAFAVCGRRQGLLADEDAQTRPVAEKVVSETDAFVANPDQIRDRHPRQDRLFGVFEPHARNTGAQRLGFQYTEMHQEVRPAGTVLVGLDPAFPQRIDQLRNAGEGGSVDVGARPKRADQPVQDLQIPEQGTEFRTERCPLKSRYGRNERLHIGKRRRRYRHGFAQRLRARRIPRTDERVDWPLRIERSAENEYAAPRRRQRYPR